MGNTVPKSPQIPPSHQPPPQQLQEQPQPEESDDHSAGFTCEICIEPAQDSDRRFRNGDKCAHRFCTDCVIKYIRVELDHNNVGQIKCPAVGCRHALDPLDCAAVVGPVVFVRWCDALCEAAIVGMERCYCPNSGCNVLIVNECGGIAKKSKCPKCKNYFCFECKGVWHAGFACEESVEARDRNDVAFGRLVEQHMWKRCPKCRHFVELMEGCPIIKCRKQKRKACGVNSIRWLKLNRCGSSFCYRCEVLVDRPWCRCMTSSLRQCRVWCFRICIFIIFLTLALFFFISALSKHKPFSK